MVRSRAARFLLLYVVFLWKSSVAVITPAPTKSPAITRTLPQPTQLQQMEINAVTGSTNNGECRRYRHGFIGMALCTDYYDEVRNNVTYVQIIGSFTNEGIVDMCNMSLSVQSLDKAYYRSPNWLPRYPINSSIAARSYFPFTIIMVRPAGGAYPLVTIPRTFYACDKNLKELTGDAVFPPPGWVPPPELQADSSMTLAPSSSSGSVVSGSGGTVNWVDLIAYDTKCLSPCSEALYQEKVLCTGMKYVMSSGCAKTCGKTTVDWLKSQCQKSKCSNDVCAWSEATTTTHSRAQSSKTFSIILLSGIYGMFFIIKFFYH